MKSIKKITTALLVVATIVTGFTGADAKAKKLEEVNKWYPIGISQIPTKVDYKEGEKVDLSGLQIRFARYVKNTTGSYEVEYKDEEMRDYTIKYGWELMLPAKNVYNPLVDIKLRLIKPNEAVEALDSLLEPVNIVQNSEVKN